MTTRAPFPASARTQPIAAVLAAVPRIVGIALLSIGALTGMASISGTERAWAESTSSVAEEQAGKATEAAKATSRAVAYSIPSDAQASGTNGGCTWFIRSATDAENPSQFVLYPTNGVSGSLVYTSHAPWYYKNGLIKTAYIAPGVKAGKTAYGFFRGADSMTYADVGNLDLSECAELWSFFYDCTSLVAVDGLEAWDVSAIDNFSQVFKDCPALEELDLSNWNVGENPAEPLTLNAMFDGCSSLRSIGSTSAWDLSTCTSLDRLFSKCALLTEVPGIEGWNTGNVTTLYRTFYQTGMKDLDISSWKTDQATDMRGFLSSLNSGNVDSITVGTGFDFEPVGISTYGNWEDSSNPRVLFPTPSGKNAEGRTRTGQWVADSTGLVYAAGAIPTLTADTYRAQVKWTSTASLAGEASVGKTLTMVLEDSEGIELAYAWSVSSSASGPWTAIEGASEASYTAQASDLGCYLKCTATSTSGAFSGSVSAVSKQVSPPQLTGSAHITGSYVYEGGTLQASVEGAPEDAELTYSWYAGSEQGATETLVGTSSTYELTAHDVGKFLTCVITDASGAYEGTVRAEGACVTAVLSLAVPDRLQGTLSGLGEISWQEFGTAQSESSCPVRISAASSNVPGQEAALCSLEGTVLQPGATVLITWSGLEHAAPSVYAQAAAASGSFIDAGALVYVFEAA